MKTLLLSAFLSSALIAGLPAASPEELRASAEKLEAEARVAKQEGRSDVAVELMARSKKLQAEIRERQAEEQQRKGESDFKARGARELEALQRAGKDDEAQQLRRKLAQAGGADRRRDDLSPGEGGDRAQHLMEAIKHLRAAGLNEPAEHLEQMSRGMREELERGGRPGGGQPGGDRPAEQLNAATREMHAALQELREQMRKMQHQLEELRAHSARKPSEEKP